MNCLDPSLRSEVWVAEVTEGPAGLAAAEPARSAHSAKHAESSPPSRLRRIGGIVVVLLVLAGVGWAVARDWDSFVDSMHKVGWAGVLLSILFGMLAVGCTCLQWRAVLQGLDVDFGRLESAQVFFPSQLGKYLPGSVWPVVMQMEAGRTRGANRKTMLAANLVTILTGLVSGVLLAGILLPFSYPQALHRFWWALAALPVGLVLAHREPLGVQMTGSATLWASGWAALSWVFFGLHLTVLAASIGHFSAGLVALCIGGMGLAVSAGVLFLVAPAGAGFREVVLGYVLVAVVTSGQAVAVVIASRVLLIAVDLILAALAVLSVRLVRRRPDGDVRTVQLGSRVTDGN
jgi:uncharacterized membrane protein YbhN (UPF0104 family)